MICHPGSEHWSLRMSTKLRLFMLQILGGCCKAKQPIIHLDHLCQTRMTSDLGKEVAE